MKKKIQVSIIYGVRHKHSCSLQHFSDDEGEVDEPLAPLPDGLEGVEVEGDDDIEQDVADATQNKELTDIDQNMGDPPSKLSSPKPQLSIIPSSRSGIETRDSVDGLDASPLIISDSLPRFPL